MDSARFFLHGSSVGVLNSCGGNLIWIMNCFIETESKRLGIRYSDSCLARSMRKIGTKSGHSSPVLISLRLTLFLRTLRFLR